MNDGRSERQPTTGLHIATSAELNPPIAKKPTTKYLRPMTATDLDQSSKEIPDFTINKTDKDPNLTSTTFAATLNIDKNEDGPPIAKTFTTSDGTSIKIATVADGMGGAGSKRVMTPNGEKTMAYVAARTVQQGINNIITTNPDNFAKHLDDIRDTIQESFQESYSEIKAEKSTSMISGSLIKEFPTTFSGIVIQENKDSKEVMLFWSGDSPIFIFTPDNIFTTSLPDDGDAPVNSCITKNNYKLKSKQLSFPKNTPIIAVTATDGVLKLGQNSLDSAINFILNGIRNNPLDKIGQSLTNRYQQLKQSGDIELDDTTIAIAISSTPEEISKFTASSPVKTIS